MQLRAAPSRERLPLMYVCVCLATPEYIFDRLSAPVRPLSKLTREAFRRHAVISRGLCVFDVLFLFPFSSLGRRIADAPSLDRGPSHADSASRAFGQAERGRPCASPVSLNIRIRRASRVRITLRQIFSLSARLIKI